MSSFSAIFDFMEKEFDNLNFPDDIVSADENAESNEPQHDEAEVRAHTPLIVIPPT